MVKTSKRKEGHLSTIDDAENLEKIVKSEKSLFTMEDQINFAWRNFEDQQGIIRAADLKAGYLVTFLLFFGASTIPLGEEVMPKLHWISGWKGFATAVYLLTYTGQMLAFVRSLYLISRVLTPRVAPHHSSPQKGSDLLYYEHVIQHKESSHYYEALSQASSQRILRNITDQVFQLSHICKSKIDCLREFATSFKWTVFFWLTSTAIGLWITRWK
jgi:hypothetical protein